MAPTTRSLKKKKSPSSKQKDQQKHTTSEHIKEVLICVDEDSDISSDDSFSTDSEMEDLVQQTALRMTGYDHAENTRKEKPKGSKSDTDLNPPVFQFILDANPNSKSDIRIEVDHVCGTISREPAQIDDNEERVDAVLMPAPSECVQTTQTGAGNKEEEAFISLEPASASDSQSKEQHRKQRTGRGNNLPRKLATEIDPGLDPSDTYLTFAGPRKTKTSAGMVLMKSSQDKLLKTSVITPDFEKQHSIPPYREATRLLNRRKKKELESSTGQNWYNMAAAEMTKELRNDIKALRMRSSLDPKRFYKHNDMTALPKFVQIGTVVESPADFYHSRIPKKQRKQTIVDELLADAETRRYNKRKYLELQERSKRRGQRTNRNKKGKKKGGK